jgi:hypothetical protein
MQARQTEVVPFGIVTLLVNPGFFRTELLTKEPTRPHRRLRRAYCAHPRYPQPAHLLENLGTTEVRFTPADL